MRKSFDRRFSSHEDDCREKAEQIRHAFDTYRTKVFDVALGLTRDEEVAADITQDVFLDLWENNTFDSKRGSLLQYLRMRARGKAIDALRSEDARNCREDNYFLQSWPLTLSIEADALNVCINEKLVQALSRICDNEQDAIKSAYFEFRPYVEAASHLGITEGVFKHHVRMGFAQLRSDSSLSTHVSD